MSQGSDVVISVGLQADFDGLISELVSKLSGLKNIDLGLASAMEKEVDDAVSSLKEIQKAVSNLGKTKLNKTEFSKFEKNITSSITQVENRVQILETSMNELMTVMNSADGSKLASQMQEIHSALDSVKSSAEQTTDSLKEISNLSSGTGVKVNILSPETEEDLKKQKNNLNNLVNEIEKIQNQDYELKMSYNKKDFAKPIDEFKFVKAQMESMYETFDETTKKMNKATPGTDEYDKLAKQALEAAHNFNALYDILSTIKGLNGRNILSDYSDLDDELFNQVDNISTKLATVKDEIESQMSKIREALRTGETKSDIDVQKEKVTVPLEISTKTDTLRKRAMEIISKVQSTISSKPIEVEFALVSGFKTKKSKEIVGQLKKYIDTSDDEELKASLSTLYSDIQKRIDQDLNLRITSSIDTSAKEVNKWINTIQDELRKQKLYFSPEVKFTEENIGNIQNVLNEASKGLKLNLQKLELSSDFSVKTADGKEITNAMNQAVKESSQEARMKKAGSKKTPEVQNLSELKGMFQSIQNLIDSLSFDKIESQFTKLITQVSEFKNAFQKAFDIKDVAADLDVTFDKIKNDLNQVTGKLDKENRKKMQSILKDFTEYKKAGGEKGINDLVSGLTLSKAEITSRRNWLKRYYGTAKKEDSTIDTVKVKVVADTKGFAGQIKGAVDSLGVLKVPVSLSFTNDDFKSLSSFDDLSKNIQGVNNLKTALSELNQLGDDGKISSLLTDFVLLEDAISNFSKSVGSNIDIGGLEKLESSLKSIGDNSNFDKLISSFKDLKASLKDLDISKIGAGLSEEDLGLPTSSVEDRLKQSFENIKASVSQIDGALRGNNLKRIREALRAYQEYRRYGGTEDFASLSKKDNIQKWFKKHINDTYDASDEKLNVSNNFSDLEKGIFQLKETISSLSGLKIDTSGLDKFKTFINSLGGSNSANKFNVLSSNIRSFKSAVEGLDGAIPKNLDFKGLNELQKFISKTGTEKGLTKFDGVADSLRQLIDLLNTDVSSSGFMTSLNTLAEKGDALKDLASVLKATKTQIKNAKDATETGLKYDNLDNVLKNVDVTGNAKSFLSGYGEVLNVEAKKTKNGFLEIIGLVKTADGVFKEFMLHSIDGMNMQMEKTSENTTKIMNQVKAYASIQKAFERMNQNATPENTTNDIFFDKDFVPEDQDFYEKLIATAKEYGYVLGNIQKITREVRKDSAGNLLESFRIFADEGTYTLGRDGFVRDKQDDITGIEGTRERIKALMNDIKELHALQEQASDKSGGFDFKADEEKLKHIEEEYRAIIDLVERLNKEIPNNAANADLDKLKTTMSESYGDNIRKYIENFNKIIETGGGKTGYMPEFEEEISRAKASVIELQDLLNAHAGGGAWTAEEIKRVRQLREELDKTASGVKDDKNIKGRLDTLDKYMSKIKKSMNQNTAMPKELMANFEALYDSAKKFSDAGFISKFDLSGIGDQFNKLNRELQESGKTGLSFFDIIASKAKYMSAELIGQFLSLYDVIRYARELAAAVTEVDTALTELQKVSNASDMRLEQSFQTSTETAKEYGSTITDVIQSTSDWARSGYNVEESEELARVTTLYQKVGDNMTQESASESLVSTLRGFQMDFSESEHIVDVINEVSNNMAISSEGIGQALQRSAAAFNVGNTGLEEATAVISGINEIAQDPEKVGNAVKTLTARLRGSEAELQDMGEDTDGLVTSTSKLRDLVKAMTGFDIMKNANEFKSVYDIIVGIGEKWEDLSDIEQASLLEKLAGMVFTRNHSNVYL